jgi:hypothetical protein
LATTRRFLAVLFLVALLAVAGDHQAEGVEAVRALLVLAVEAAGALDQGEVRLREPLRRLRSQEQVVRDGARPDAGEREGRADDQLMLIDLGTTTDNPSNAGACASLKAEVMLLPTDVPATRGAVPEEEAAVAESRGTHPTAHPDPRPP